LRKQHWAPFLACYVPSLARWAQFCRKKRHRKNVKFHSTRHWLKLANPWLVVTRQFLWLGSDSTKSWLDSDATRKNFWWHWLDTDLTKIIRHITAWFSLSEEKRLTRFPKTLALAEEKVLPACKAGYSCSSWRNKCTWKIAARHRNTKQFRLDSVSVCKESQEVVLIHSTRKIMWYKRKEKGIMYSCLTYSILNWGMANKTTLLPLIRVQNKAVRTLEYNETKTTVLYSKHKILEIQDLFKLSVDKFMYSFYSGGLSNHFDNYFAEIASAHKYQTRLASLQKYYLPRLKTSLGQLSLKYIGPKIWSDIPENLKSSSPYSFGKQYKNVLLSCENSCWSLFYVLVTFCNTVLMPRFSPIYLYICWPHPLYIGILFSRCFLLSFFLYYLTLIWCILLHFLLFVKRLQLKFIFC